MLKGPDEHEILLGLRCSPASVLCILSMASGPMCHTLLAIAHKSVLARTWRGLQRGIAADRYACLDSGGMSVVDISKLVAEG